jgi:signal transduction histidine kinase
VNRLSLKIFLSFFATLLLIAVGAVLVTSYVVNERREAAPTAMRDLLQSAETALAEGGRDGLTEWLRGRNARLFGTPVFIVDAAGVDLLGRPLPPRRRPIHRAMQHYIPVLRGPDGEQYRFVFAPTRPPVFGVFSLPQTRGAMLLLAILAGGLVSWALARSLTRPIADLQRAARGLAAGDLNTQVAPATRRRRDELGQLGAAFDSMAGDLRELVEGRERLLRDVSHELRSPLARMRLAVGLAQQPGSNVAAQIARMETEIARLDALIGAILDVSRLESGARSLQPVAVDLVALIDGIVADARFEAESVGCSIAWTPPPAMPMQADPHWLAAAIENVIRNALRHAPPGSSVDVTLQQGPGVGQACLVVRDRGPGVQADQLGRIFEPFYRVAEARERSSGGAGLGLAIAARVIRAHGGSIAATRAEPGLAVTMTVPIGPQLR